MSEKWGHGSAGGNSASNPLGAAANGGHYGGGTAGASENNNGVDMAGANGAKGLLVLIWTPTAAGGLSLTGAGK